MTITSHKLKQAIRNKFAWPGGYELFGITSDGGVLCCKCMREEWRNIVQDRLWKNGTGWLVEAIDCSANLESEDFVKDNPDDYSLTCCDHCNHVLNP